MPRTVSGRRAVPIASTLSFLFLPCFLPSFFPSLLPIASTVASFRPDVVGRYCSGYSAINESQATQIDAFDRHGGVKRYLRFKEKPIILRGTSPSTCRANTRGEINNPVTVNYRSANDNDGVIITRLVNTA